MKVKCPICDRAMPGQKVEWPDHPFCSPRCRMIDLGRWLGEDYKIPAKNQPVDEDESSDKEDLD
jgi:uncharacterized protein